MAGQTARAAPGPIYDNALRLLATRDLVALCSWLGIEAGAGGPAERAGHLRRALAVVAAVADPHRRGDLLHTAATLAGIHFGPDTIEEFTREVGMPWTLDEDTVAGRSIAAAAEARGEARGEVLERTRTLTALLRRTFGDDPRVDAVARRLAALPRERALDAALTATTLDGLLAHLGTDGGRPDR